MIRPFHYVFLFLLFFSFACNFPGLALKSTALPPESLRQTIEAPYQPTSTNALLVPVNTPAATSFSISSQATLTPENSLPTSVNFSHNPDSFQYAARPGDTLLALAGRFGVESGQINSIQVIPPQSFISIGQVLEIPNTADVPPYPIPVLPDSEVINAPSTRDFDIQQYVDVSGFLSGYSENVSGKRISGVEIIQRVSLESSVNPRFLLALLEFRSGWVLGRWVNASNNKYPIGFQVSNWEGLYKELIITATHLNAGYYGWRAGKVTELAFRDRKSARISPQLNAGSVAVQYLFAMLYYEDAWQEAIYGSDGFLSLYQQMFGDPWSLDSFLFPDGLAQPVLELPFVPGQRWSLTGGPHVSWKTGSPPGALDLAPVTGEPRCSVSRVWVTASARGLVVRSDRNVVVIDLDGDGFEQTGWTILYMHIADAGRIANGTWVEVDDPIGHPSCEGGNATGTHIHIARKYNGEWIAADGPLPFVLSGWVAYAGPKEYLGGLRKGDQIAMASPVGPRTSIVMR